MSIGTARRRVLSDSAAPAPTIIDRFARDWRKPLLRNGLLLTVSSGLSALIGFAFWALVARHYDTASVGSNSAAISMAVLAATVAQLNLSSAMVRFVPTAGRRTAALIAGAHALSAGLALIVAVGSVLAVRVLAPGTTFLSDDRAQVLFVAGTVAVTLFVLQDGVLVGLRRTPVVPLANIVFAVAKLVLVVAVAAALPRYGIFASWTVSSAAVVVLVGAYLFFWAIPHRKATADTTETLPPMPHLARFVAADYVGSVCSIGAAMLLPILVLHALGPVPTAYFSIAWAIANVIHLINTNFGTSLVAESATDPSQFARNVHQVLVHGAKLVLPIVAAVLVLAPIVLAIFGSEYRAGADVLRLLAVAAVPGLLVSTAISSARANRRLRLLLSIQASNFVLTVGLAWVLLDVVGVAGAGLACLLSQTIIACALLARRDLWWFADTAQHAITAPTSLRLRSAAALFVLRSADTTHTRRILNSARALLRRRRSRDRNHELLRLAARLDASSDTWTTARSVRTVTDIEVGYLGRGSDMPTAVLKVARSPLAATDLRRQREILATLAADSRLDSWCLLPHILAFADDAESVTSIETFHPRADMGAILTAHPDLCASLSTIALASISELHHRTGYFVTVDEVLLTRWVDEPVRTLTDLCATHSPASADVAETLRRSLRAALAGHLVLAGWAHGDLHGGNVMIDSGRVTAIIDWGGARPDWLCLLDAYHLVLTTTATVEQRELGTVLARRLRTGGLADHERRLLDSGGNPRTGHGEGLDERMAILLTWLHHVVALSRKCGAFHEHRVWWALNAEPVLRAFGEQTPAITARLRAAELAGVVDRPAHRRFAPIAQRSAVATFDSEQDRATSPAVALRERSDQLSVSVVVCSYTDERWDSLARAVASVRTQSRSAAEIVVVIDHNPSMLARAVDALPGVRVVPNRYARGLSGARNSGSEISTGDIVAFLDDDAYADTDWLAELSAPYTDPAVLGVGGLVTAHWLTARPPWFPAEFDWVVGCTYRGMSTGRAAVRNMIGANMSFRRELLVESGGFHTGLGRVGARPLGCEETELCIRLQNDHPGGRFMYEPEARVWHSVPATRTTWSYFRSRCYAEGRSKATVSHLAGADRALASERSYLTSTVPRGTLRYFGAGLRGRLWGFVTAIVMMLGVTATTIGYATGTTAHRRTPDRPEVAGSAGVWRYTGVTVAAALWAVSLPRIDLERIGDYGLLPLLPFTFWAGTAVLLVSFGVLVQTSAATTRLLAAHVAVLIAILHATPSVVYETLRYSWAWKHVGIVDFFQRHNGVDTTLNELAVYQFWPGFFNLNAMLVQAGGLESALGYAAWAPPVFNLLLIGPLYLIFTTFSTDRRLIWSAIVIYVLGAWVGQDYFAPQACANFLYLTIVALVLRYMRRESRALDRRMIAVFAIVPMMAAIVPTHQLTAPMVILALGLLAVFRVRRVFVLTVFMVAMTLGWDLLFAGPWLSENLSGLLANFGNAESNAGANFIDLSAGSRSQSVVAEVDRALSAAIWLLAAVGFARRFRTRGELALPLLAIAPLPLILSNDYGGEMVFRVYLFGLPFVAFYAAAAFFPRPVSAAPGERRRGRLLGRLVLPAVLLLLVTGFGFGYYGKEQTSYFAPEELAASQFVYGIAPRGSLIVGATSGFPWAFKNFEFYDHLWFATLDAEDRRAVVDDPISQLGDMMSAYRHHHSYLILTRSQAAGTTLSGDLPGDALARIEQTLSESPKFTVLYRNTHAVVITLTQPAPER
ncbi:glycosyltransferase [Nocardia sp. NPDC056064]|uniref:glycosyltransferase n=1 Tax=Nocardia sp. NPDC056064 TaxID=3345701 RepID=UPI0035D539ED